MGEYHDPFHTQHLYEMSPRFLPFKPKGKQNKKNPPPPPPTDRLVMDLHTCDSHLTYRPFNKYWVGWGRIDWGSMF